MKSAWYKAAPDRFATVKKDIETEYPDLRVFIDREVVFARGSFPVKDGNDVLDRFLIEIEFPSDFPDSVPVLREIGGRIPWNADRHVNPTGETCPIVPEEWLVRSDRDSMRQFLDGPIRNFFLGQILVEHGKPWPFSERPHGTPGLLQSYRELLSASDDSEAIRYLDYLSRKIVKGHWECPCGRGKRLRNCHLEKLKDLQKRITPAVAKQALRRLGRPSLK
jgi:hypothetical protein